MNENKILNNLSDKVTLSPDKKRIEIIHAIPASLIPKPVNKLEILKKA